MRLTENKKLFISAFTALAAAFFFPFALKLELGSTVFSNSIVPLLLAVGFFAMNYAFSKVATRRLSAIAGILGFVFSLILAVGRTVALDQHLAWTEIPLLLLAAVFISLAITPSLGLALHYTPKLRDILLGLRINERLERLLFSRMSGFFVLWAVILLCWIPVFLALYPGVFGYDVHKQVPEIIYNAYTTHHPVFHTLWLAFFIYIGEIFGSFEIATAAHSVAQMLILSAVFAYALFYLRRFKVPAIVKLIGLLFFALHPINPMYAVNITKDVLFSAAILMFFLSLVDVAVERERFFRSKTMVARLVLSALFVVLLRNQGIYLVVACLPFLVLMNRTVWKRALAVGLAAVVLPALAVCGIDAAVHAQKGGSAEMLSVPMQQIARTVYEHGDELSPQDYERIHATLPERGLSCYTPETADYVKDWFDSAAFDADPLGFFANYIGLGLRFPESYTDAFLIMNLGYWYPDADFHEFQSYISIDNRTDVGNGISVERESKLPALLPYIEGVAHQYNGKVYPFEALPFIASLFSIGLQFWFMLYFSTDCIYRRRYRLLLAMVPLFVLWLTLLVSPVVIARYMYPVFVCVPVMLALLFTKWPEEGLRARR